ncbi:MAG: DUF1194 domain-containing protein [Pseudomonadota bacterium]
MRMIAFALPFILGLLIAAPVAAQDVDLELVLLADASGSMSADEVLFQRQGYAQAMTDPQVVEAITNTAYGKIAVVYVEWAGNQAVVLDWTFIEGADTAQAFADALLVPPRQAYGRNAIGAALLEGKRLIEDNDIDGWRKVIDFSGDSARNFSGPPIAVGRAEVIAAGITINGLPIDCRVCSSGATRSDLAQVYEDQIIGGLGAFVVAAQTAEDLSAAIKRKLILEISSYTIGAPRVAGR